MIPFRASMLGAAVFALAAGVTWNPAAKSAGAVLSNGNHTLTGDGGGDWESARGTTGLNSGKHYFDARIAVIGGAGGGPGIGIADAAASLTTYLGQDVHSAGYFANGYYGTSNSYASAATLTVNDVFGVAVDIGAAKVWFAKNNVWHNGDPAAGTGGTSIAGIGATIYPFGQSDGSGSLTAGANYAPPSGFSAVIP